MTARAEILRLLSARPLTAGDLIARTRYDASYLRRLLSEMWAEGEIDRGGKRGSTYSITRGEVK